MSDKKYLFTSERLGFREWSMADLDEFTTMNADEAVMEHFPKPLTQEESRFFIQRLQKHYQKHNYQYFATELLESGELIGFVGLAYQDYEAAFTPTTDIGWRLKRSAWGNGYATEGARRCLQLAFEDFQLERVVSVCALPNQRSENVMRKIGMTKQSHFQHPKLKAYPHLETCVWYEIKATDWATELK